MCVAGDVSGSCPAQRCQIKRAELFHKGVENEMARTLRPSVWASQCRRVTEPDRFTLYSACAAVLCKSSHASPRATTLQTTSCTQIEHAPRTRSLRNPPAQKPADQTRNANLGGPALLGALKNGVGKTG